VVIRLYRTAKWRSSPASDAQKKLVENRWSKTLSNWADIRKEEFFTKLTKGNAAIIITRIKHGAVVCLSLNQRDNHDPLYSRDDIRKK